MPLIHWKPFEDLEQLFEDMSSGAHGWDLAADVYEEGNSVMVKMHIPEINPDHLDIEIEDNHLHITGSREHKEEVKDRHYFKKEIRCGSFERVIALPYAVDEDSAQAEFCDGVLKIKLAKANHIDKNKKRIPITRK